MEKIYDLINPKNIFVGVSGQSGLVGATKLNISSEQELIDIVKKSSDHRKTQDTRLNSVSSRSHCIIIIGLKKYLKEGTEKCGQLYLVDLAGCERIANFSESSSDEQDNIKRIIKNTSLINKLKFANTLGSEINKTLVDESKNINKSIFSLNNVVSACSSGQKFIPYRNSKITMVLKNAIGGNSNTLIAICCSDNISETIMTLRFGTRCKKIKNKTKNNIMEKDTRDLLIIKLQTEINELKDLLEISKNNLDSFELKNQLEYPYNNDFSVNQDTKRSDPEELDENICDKLVSRIFGDLIDVKTDNSDLQNALKYIGSTKSINLKYKQTPTEWIPILESDVNNLSAEEPIQSIGLLEDPVGSILSDELQIHKIDPIDECIKSVDQIDECIKSVDQIDECIKSVDQIDECIKSVDSIDVGIKSVEPIDVGIKSVDQKGRPPGVEYVEFKCCRKLKSNIVAEKEKNKQVNSSDNSQPPELDTTSTSVNQPPELDTTSTSVNQPPELDTTSTSVNQPPELDTTSTSVNQPPELDTTSTRVSGEEITSGGIKEIPALPKATIVGKSFCC
jgi:hypothetical protein